MKNDTQYLVPGFADAIDGTCDGTRCQWTVNRQDLPQAPALTACRATVEQRSQYAEYFAGPGNTDFQ